MPSTKTMKDYMQSRKRMASPTEPMWLRSSKKQKIRAVSPITKKQLLEHIPHGEAPRSKLYTPSELSGRDVRGRQLEGDRFELFYKGSIRAVDRLRCRMNVSIGCHSHVIDFRLVEGKAKGMRDEDRLKTEVVITEILEEDDTDYHCHTETKVFGAVWYAKVKFDKAFVEEPVVMRWLASQGEINEIREMIEECLPPHVEAAYSYFRTISVINRPQKGCKKPIYHLLVDSWDGLTSMKAEGTVVESEVVYRGDEKEKRLWLKLRLRIVPGQASACFIYVSGDVESESWVHGRFRDDFPGELLEE